jgi:hypothetical protein
MTTLREAAQQALEALEAGPDVDPIFAGETEDALRAALAEPMDETTLDVSGATCFSATPAKWPVKEEQPR